MNDMTVATVPKSDQINADDLIGRNLTIRVAEVRISPGQEQPVSIFFEGSPKPFRPCKSMSRVLVNAWGADANKYVGRRMTLYRDPTVRWGGLEVGGIRISHLSDIDRKLTMSLTATKGKWKPFEVQPLRDTAQPVKAAQRQENGHSDDPDDAPPEPPRYTLEDAELEGADVETYEQATAWWRRCKAASRTVTGEDAKAWGKLLAEAQERGEKLKAAA